MIKISVKFVVGGTIDNKSALAQVMAQLWTVYQAVYEQVFTRIQDTKWWHKASMS